MFWMKKLVNLLMIEGNDDFFISCGTLKDTKKWWVWNDDEASITWHATSWQ